MKWREFITLLARPMSGWPQHVLVQHSDWAHLIVTLSGMACMLSSPSSLSQELVSQGKEAASEQQVFNNACRTCHTIKEGDNRLGPNLYKIIGRKAGSLPDYSRGNEGRRLCLGRGKARAFHRKPRCGRARQQHEAVWRSRIDRRQRESHRFPAVSHDRSTVTHLAKQKRFPDDPCQRSLGQTRSAQSNAWKEMESWLRSVRTRSKSPLKAVALSSLARQSAR